jgi:hypothetical protein
MSDLHQAPNTELSSDRPFFPAEEWSHFQDEDIHAGKAIAGLMATIFAIGIVLYTFVALSVAF